MTKTVKTASFKSFEAAKLAAGKYAGLCISRSEEREHEGKFFTYYSSGARKVSRDWYGVRAADLAAIGYDCLGFWDVPAGLKAAALMVCRISDYSRNFRFSLDRSGAWSFHYGNPEGFEYSNGSAEDVKGDRVEMDDDQNARDFVWALSRFERVQLWAKNGKIFMAVGSIDDGNLLLLNDGVNARFVDAGDDVWTVDPVAEVVAAVASYPAAPVAACVAPRAENDAQEGENARGGADVPPEAETATERKETAKAEAVPEPVEGKRDFLRDIRKGDVVRISGIKGTTGKSINGLYYVETVHGAGDYWLNSLKRDRGSDFEGIGKKSHSWPLRCYANNPKICAEFRENIKDAKIEGMGPRSAAVYSLMLRGLYDLRANMEKCGYWGKFHQEEMQKRADDLAADLRRMREENPGLDRFAAKLDEKFKPTGPGLAIRADGLEVRTDCGTWDKYSLALRHVGDRIFISGSYYGRRSSTIPAGFCFDVTNNSDSQTDYFEADRATVTPEHPLFKVLARIIDAGRGRYELTDDDAKRCAEYLESKRAEAEAQRTAKEEAERAERERKYAELDRAISDAVETYTEQYPATEGQATGRIIWSENGVLNAEGSESGKNTVFSLTALDLVMAEADHAHQRIFGPHSGYDKTRIRVELPDGYTLEERIDIGDGVGGIYESHLHTMKWHTEQALTNGEDHNWVEAQKVAVEREAHILEMLHPWCDLGGLLVLNDLEAMELGETA